jgi:hypothetical protein
MSDEYEVHGPHDHAVEHVGEGHHAHADADPFASRMAVMTAILATIGAIYAYQSGTSENLALYYKNEAAIKKTEAANQWLSAPDSDAHAKFLADVEKYKQQKEPIRANAEAIEKDVTNNDAQSEKLLHGHHRWAQATTLIQISIALTAITLLTRKKWLRNLSLGVAAAGILFGAAAFLSV